MSNTFNGRTQEEWLASARNWEEKAKRYGDDMKSSRQSCLMDAQKCREYAELARLGGHRAIWKVAYDIRKEWGNVYFGAKPYLDAMDNLERVTDYYGSEPAYQIVLYFLSNCSTFRGEKARALKNELKSMFGIK